MALCKSELPCLPPIKYAIPIKSTSERRKKSSRDDIVLPCPRKKKKISNTYGMYICVFILKAEVLCYLPFTGSLGVCLL